jgi:hypothetical protein
VIEDYGTGADGGPDGNPNYHSSSDTLETLNLEFGTDMARAAAAALAVLADE